ncbi:MAG: hypothetical protein QW569_00205 [Candidatus Bathyarchaeia archaeon]|nr:hypothetical protein [Candidatus Bathyarchaeota archaeon]
MDDRLRFKLRRGDVEVELEGEFGYVKEKFERLFEAVVQGLQYVSDQRVVPRGLDGVMERTEDGRPYLVIPVDKVTSREALALFLYASSPRRLSDRELAEVMTMGWKTIRAEAVRARASELRKEGKLVSEDGRYTLSGAGIQWVENEILAKLRAQGGT